MPDILNYDHRPPPPYNRRALISFLLAVISATALLTQAILGSTNLTIPSIFGSCCCLSPLGNLLALTFGAMALSQFSENGARYRGQWMAILGTILAIIALLATCIYIAFILLHPHRTF